MCSREPAFPANDVGVVHAHVSLVIWLKEQRKQSFLTLPKENKSPLGLYRNPPTFLLTDPCFVLLIRDRHFALLSLCHASAFVTNHRCLRYAYIILRNGFRIRQLAEVRERCLYPFKYGYFSYKNTLICYRRPLFTPRSRVMRVLFRSTRSTSHYGKRVAIHEALNNDAHQACTLGKPHPFLFKQQCLLSMAKKGFFSQYFLIPNSECWHTNPCSILYKEETGSPQ